MIHIHHATSDDSARGPCLGRHYYNHHSSCTTATAPPPPTPTPPPPLRSPLPPSLIKIQQVRESELLELRTDLSERDRTIKELQEQVSEAEKARREMHNKIQELRGNIRVMVRCRPFLAGDGVDLHRISNDEDDLNQTESGPVTAMR